MSPRKFSSWGPNPVELGRCHTMPEEVQIAVELLVVDGNVSVECDLEGNAAPELATGVAGVSTGLDQVQGIAGLDTVEGGAFHLPGCWVGRVRVLGDVLGSHGDGQQVGGGGWCSNWSLCGLLRCATTGTTDGWRCKGFAGKRR